jgi:hypothetical protein
MTAHRARRDRRIGDRRRQEQARLILLAALIVLVLVAAVAPGAKPGSARSLTLAGIVWHNEMTNNAAA